MGKKLLPLYYALGVALLVGLLLAYSDLFEAMELKLLDLRYYYRNSEEYQQDHYPEDVVIVGIDLESLDKIGKWPWRRLYYSRLIDVLVKAKAKAIFFDIFLFHEDNKYPEDDAELIKTAQEAGNVYFDYYFYNREDKQTRARQEAAKMMEKFSRPYQAERILLPAPNTMSAPFPALLEQIKGAGHASIDPDKTDGVLRKTQPFIYYQERIYPLISLKLYLDLHEKSLDDIELSLGNWRGKNTLAIGDMQIPVNYRGSMMINYLGEPKTVQQISYADVLEGNVQYDWEDKVVFVGATALSLMYEDIKMTPLGQMTGIEMLATIYDNLVNEDFLSRTTFWNDMLIILGLCLVVALTLLVFSPLVSAIITLMLMMAYMVACQFAFDEMSLWVTEVPALWAVFATFTSANVHRYAVALREKQRIKNTFSYYLPQELIEFYVANPEHLKAKGESKCLTILFSDIRNFTSWSESLPAGVVVEQLNEYLDAMTEKVYANRGVIDKYIGDAIMAIFGAPITYEEHAACACKTALAMLEELKKLHLKWEKEGKSLLNIGIGLNTGEMVVGNMGSTKRLNYSVIGDAVNLSSRLEGANKVYGTNIIISEFTYEVVKKNAEVRELGETSVKGRSQPIKIYELTGWRE